MKDQGYEHAHSSPIKTPQQLAIVVVLAFVVPVIGLVLLAGVVISGYCSAALQGEEPDAVARRIQPVARLEFAAAAAGPHVAKTGEEVYKAGCSSLSRRFPDDLHPLLREALEREGIQRLYSHQAEAIEAIQNGRDVVVVTPTASGKTLCYNLPVLNFKLSAPSSRAFYLFPTKALSQDQMVELKSLIGRLEKPITTLHV